MSDKPLANAPAAQRSIKGNLSATPVPNMLHTVRDRALTGRVSFQRNGDRVDLAVRDGQIVHAASNDPDQRLGEILLREGMITLEHYIESVQILLETGERQGEIMVDREWLDRNQLKRGVRVQMKEIIYWLMSWETGDYTFRWSKPVDEAIQIRTNMYELILRGMRRCDRFSKLREVLAPWHRLVALNTGIDMEVARQIRLKEDESTILSLTDGTRSVAGLVDFSPYPDLVTMQILYGLKWARIVEFFDEDLDPEDTLP